MDRQLRQQEKTEKQLIIVTAILVIAMFVFLTFILILLLLPPQVIVNGYHGQFAYVYSTSNTTAVATFDGFSVDPNPFDLLIVLATDTSSGTYSWGSNADGTTLTLETGSNMGTIIYRDFQDNGKANAGDMLIISDLSPSTYYTVKMLWRDGSTLDTESFETAA